MVVAAEEAADSEAEALAEVALVAEVLEALVAAAAVAVARVGDGSLNGCF